MPVISATTFKLVAQWIATRINSEELSALIEQNMYDEFVADSKKPKEKVVKEKVVKEPKAPKEKVVKEPKAPKEKVVKEPKAPKEKVVKEPKAPKEKVVKEPKAPKNKKIVTNDSEIVAAINEAVNGKSENTVEPVAVVATEVAVEETKSKKGGRKPKKAAEPVADVSTESTAELVAEPVHVSTEVAAEESKPKKGGRKPKATTKPVAEVVEEVVVTQPSTTVEDEEVPVEIEVEAIVYEDVEYLHDPNNGNVYDMESTLIGKMVNDKIEFV